MMRPDRSDLNLDKRLFSFGASILGGSRCYQNHNLAQR